MEPLVDAVLEDPRWESLNLAALAHRAAETTLVQLGLAPEGFTLCLMGCDDARIAALNADFRGKPTPTNVLSWPSEDRASDTFGAAPDLPEPGPADDPTPLGDIAISYDTCLAEASAQHKSAESHVTHLVVHGILHLFGYDHEDDEDAALMETTEARILETLGIADPYGEAAL